MVSNFIGELVMLPTLGAGQRSNERLEEALSQTPTRFCSNEQSYQDEQP